MATLEIRGRTQR